MANHTPGPWRVEQAETGDGTHLVYAGESLIAETGDDDQQANAALIASAPSMAKYIAMRAALGDTEAVALLQEIQGCRQPKTVKPD